MALLPSLRMADEKTRAYLRAYYEAHRDEIKERSRANYWANRDDRIAYQRTKRRQPGEREKGNERARKARQKWTAADKALKVEEARRWRHGLAVGQLADLRRQQDDRCYLCGDVLDPSDAAIAIDHDHRCCPRSRSCGFCRRGLACNYCNAGIGMFNDDPERMRRVADALEKALADASLRLAGKPQQLDLMEG